jgi:hypothetical protein
MSSFSFSLKLPGQGSFLEHLCAHAYL